MDVPGYNIDGGVILRRIGVTFFVSYLYYKFIDKKHLAWKSIQTKEMRITNIEKSKKYHYVWLEYVLDRYERNLDTNTLGIKGLDVKKMAAKLLELYEIAMK